MSRPLRIEFPGAVYHVTSRGDRREAIFLTDADRAGLLDIVGTALARFDASALAWCLMGNHYHFVLHTRGPNLSLLMRQINGVYTQAFNRRHAKVGHVFQGRFKAVLVDRDAYLLEVCRYVDLNPVRARMVEEPALWPWSSYRVNAGLYSPPPDWQDRDALWGHLLGRCPASAADRLQAAELYRALVAAGREVRLWDKALREQIYLGDEAFVQRMQTLVGPAQRADVEVPRAQRTLPVTLAQWLRRCATRDEAILRAHRESHLSMTDIAHELGLSVSWISRLVAAGERGGAGAQRQALDLKAIDKTGPHPRTPSPMTARPWSASARPQPWRPGRAGLRDAGRRPSRRCAACRRSSAGD